MSTGSGVVHSEMPLADATYGLHGFQIWLNMPAKDKMRPAIYKDSTDTSNPEISNSDGAILRALAGDWQFAGEETISAPVQGLAGQGIVADLMLNKNAHANIDLSQHQYAGLYLYQGNLINTEQVETKHYSEGQYLIVDSQTLLSLQSGEQGAGALIFAGDPINEEIVHMGPFVMNTQAEIRQAIEDYQAGRFGSI